MSKYTQRADGRYVTRVKDGFKEDGKAKYKYVYAATEAELTKKVKSYERQQEHDYVDPEKTTITEWLDHWLNDVKKGTVAQNTWEFYRSVINVVIKPDLGAITLAKLQPKTIRTFYTKLKNEGLSDARINHTHVVLNNSMKVALEDGILDRNPCFHSTVKEKAKKPQKKKDIFVFTQDQIDALIAYQSGWWKAFVHLGWATGMRREELLGLRWMDIDTKKCTVSIFQALIYTEDEGLKIVPPKNESSFRTITVDKSCMAEMLRHQESQKEERRVAGVILNARDLVFSIKGALPDPRNISKEFKDRCLKAGLPEESHLHALRHTHATQLLKAGVHPKKVQYRLGHSTYQMTMDIYSHVTPEMQDDIPEILTALRTVKKRGRASTQPR